MKEIHILFQTAADFRSDIASNKEKISLECLKAAVKLFESLCYEPDFRRRMNDFLTNYHWEVPMESWQPPPVISPKDTPCQTEKSPEY